MNKTVIRYSLVLLALLASARPLTGQGLRDLIGELFIFGETGDPLFLAGSADPNNPTSVQVHGEHFIPSAVSSNQSLISFLTGAIGRNNSNIPISATSSGTTFRFVGGVPVATSTSPGPIFAERATTLGKGRFYVGGSVNVLNFKTLRGIRLDDIQLNFRHENTDAVGCDEQVQDDCSKFGVPVLENDVIAFNLDLDLDVVATVFVMTYGVHDQVDIGIAVPVISTNLRGRSVAEVQPFGSTVNHFFDGTLTDPGLTASRDVSGSASGIGDIAARVKIGLNEWISVLGDARLPTGDEDNLLGSGEVSARGVGIFSKPFGDFIPHANLGYLFRSGGQADAFLATVGFVHVLAPWAALAMDFLSEVQIGENEFVLPEPVTLESPFTRTVNLTNLPNIRDDILSGTVGMKFVTPSGVTLVANSIWPLNDGGLRSQIAWTLGVEYNF